MSSVAESIPESITLNDPPTDGVTQLSFIKNHHHSNNDSTSADVSSLLASTCWDGCVRIHDTKTRAAVLSRAMNSGPLLSLATPLTGDSVITGGLDGSVRKLNIETGTTQMVGRHEVDPSIVGGNSSSSSNGCSCLVALSGASLSSTSTIVASAGWHRQCHIWDVRQSEDASCLSSSVSLPGKAFGMDYDPTGQRLVIATSGRKICIIDVRKPTVATLVLERESSLKYQTRTVQFFNDGKAIAAGSIEGRVAVEYLDELDNNNNNNGDDPNPAKKKYAFKCHRVADTVYPVNTIAFHPKFGTFATGGCDGTVVTWDGQNKKKLASIAKFPTSISALCFNDDGSELAIASSYTFEEGEREHPRDEIYIRRMRESECRPKQLPSKQ